MIIRKATINDAYRFWEIHTASIRNLCREDYSPDQIKAWTNFRTINDFRQRIIRDTSFAAEIDGKVVGYIRYNPDTNELCSLHVDPRYTRKGVGTALVEEITNDAKRRSITHLWLHSSLTAVPFYESLGFVRDKETIHMFGDVGLECVGMINRFGSR